jgi:cyclopropane fatty-acyl-phospholipid synthase-like methyltransferase
MNKVEELPFSAPAERNKESILQVLQRLLTREARVLEIASGWGQHAQHFARMQAGWAWQPSDVDPSRLPMIDTRCAGLANARPALQLDVVAATWPASISDGAPYDALLCVNMLHASPWATCPGLMRGAAAHLARGGLLILYGPYRMEDMSTAPSNEAFDADLKSRDPTWGLRALADVQREAEAVGLGLREVVTMPANNLIVVFARGE